jgi:hypothetical protein
MDYTPTSNKDVVACNEAVDVPEGTWQLDFSKGWEKSRWNCIILSRMVNDLLTMCKEENGWNVVDVSDNYLLGLFYGQLRCSCKAWSQVQLRFSVENKHEETEEEAVNQAISYESKQYKAVGSRACQQQVILLFSMNVIYSFVVQQKYNKQKKIVEAVFMIKTSQGAVDLKA